MAPAISVPREQFFRPDSRVFAMGSCFAGELRKALVGLLAFGNRADVRPSNMKRIEVPACFDNRPAGHKETLSGHNDDGVLCRCVGDDFSLRSWVTETLSTVIVAVSPDNCDNGYTFEGRRWGGMI